MKQVKKVGGLNAGQWALTVAMLAVSGVAMAAIGSYGSAGSSDPMGDGICWFVGLITGKWIFGISVICLVATAGSFMAGVEMNEFMKKTATTVLVVSFIFSAVKFATALASFFGVTPC